MGAWLRRLWRALWGREAAEGGDDASPALDGAPGPSCALRCRPSRCEEDRPRADPRCIANNCTSCCRAWCPAGCGGRGPRAAAVPPEASAPTMADVRELWRQAIPLFVECACGQRNHVPYSLRHRRLGCARCRRLLEISP